MLQERGKEKGMERGIWKGVRVGFVCDVCVLVCKVREYRMLLVLSRGSFHVQYIQNA